MSDEVDCLLKKLKRVIMAIAILALFSAIISALILFR